VLRRVAGQPVEVEEADLARARRPDDVHDGVESGERHRHVRRMSGDAVLRVTDDREVAMLTLACRTAAPRGALVARLRRVLEVGAAGALEQVPPVVARLRSWPDAPESSASASAG